MAESHRDPGKLDMQEYGAGIQKGKGERGPDNKKNSILRQYMSKSVEGLTVSCHSRQEHISRSI